MEGLTLVKAPLKECLEFRFKVFCQEYGAIEKEELDIYDNIAVHYLVMLNENPIGTTRSVYSGEKVVFGRFALLKSYRRKGIGSVVNQLREIEAIKQGCKFSYLNSITPEFHEAQGYIKTSTQSIIDSGIEVWPMKKELQ